MQEYYHSDCSCSRNAAENSRVGEIYHHLNTAKAPLAMVYVPYQHWDHIYEPCKALRIGTIFAELNKPFCGKGGACR